MISAEDFFEDLLNDIETFDSLKEYYGFMNGSRSLRVYRERFITRMNYCLMNLEGKVLDVGCGFGTTMIFLALNGFSVSGITLEFYHPVLLERLDKYKSRFTGDVSFKHSDFFEEDLSGFDCILLQDTLHHLEPMGSVASKISQFCAQGRLVVCLEENGGSLLKNARLFLKRGSEKIIKFTDSHTGKTILLGNENVRSLKRWRCIFEQVGLELVDVKFHASPIGFFFDWAGLRIRDPSFRSHSSFTQPFFVCFVLRMNTNPIKIRNI